MRYLILIVLSLFTAACSPFGPVTTTPVNTYTLTVTGATAKQAHQGERVLLIAAPTAAPGYQSTSMVYTKRPFELNAFAYNRWTAAPAEMLAPLLMQNLQASGCFRAVVSPPFSGDIDLILDTRLLNLQQEFKDETSQVRLTLQMTLQDNITHQVITNQRIEAVIPAAENNPYAGVIAANKAVDVVLGKIKKVVCR
jgi:cholesterol transport system auxiliary component